MRPSLALACLAGLASAVLLPSTAGFEDDSKPLVLKLDSTTASVAFGVPCAGCLGEGSDDEALLFDFQAFPTEEPCGASNITLNGNLLTQTWDGTHAYGEGTLSSFPGPMHDDLAHDLDLSWQSSCLYDIVPNDSENARGEDVAQVLTVTVQRVNGKDVEKPSGFTISFKQLSEPHLLRLSTYPDPAAGEPESAEEWRDPPAHLRLTLSEADFEEAVDQAINLFDVGSEAPQGSYIEDDIEELKRLQAQLAELQQRIEKKQNLIRAHYYNEYQGLKEDIAQCDSITCVLKTIVHKAHGAIRTIYIHYRSGPPPPPPGASNMYHKPGRQEFAAANFHDEHREHHPHGLHHPPPPRPGCPPLPPPHCMPPPPICHGNNTNHPGDRPHHPPPHHGPPPPGHDGQGPPPPPPSSHHGHPPPPPGEGPPPPPPHHQGPPHGPPPHDGPHHEPHHPEAFSQTEGHFFPHELPPRLHRPRQPLILTISIITALFCCTALFTIIRRKCCTARARVDRLSRREERRAARQFRRAARRQAWREWWDRQRHWGRWHWNPNTDYEEKRALILEQEGQLESAMQEEIRQLRAAHDVVNSLVLAEEGRSQSYPSGSPSSSGYIPAIGAHPGYTGVPRPLSRTNSLPDYRSEAESAAPPAYEEDADSSDVVVDGFREYTPSSSSASQWTPESSVIDVSPRQSMDTLRESVMTPRESCSVRASCESKN